MPRLRNRASAAADPVAEEPAPAVEEAAAAAEVEEAEEHQSIEGAPRPLRFRDSLTWRAGKPIAVAELLRRLKTLHAELSQLDQDEAHRESLVPVAQELAHRNLLEHRDRGVKAWTALCIVEMFKLLAPDAPFKAAQLNQIFSLIITSVLPSLGNPQDPYNEQHLQIIRSLDEVKSIVLLTDIPGADGLLYKLFTGAFDIFADTAKNDKAEELGKNVEHHITSLLVTVVDESPSLPNDVVDIILAQFLRLDPTTFPLQLSKAALDSSRPFHLQLPPPAYNMAKNICTSCPDKMSRMVAHYFNSIIADLSDGVDAVKTRKSLSRRRSEGHDDQDDDDDDRDAVPAGPTAEELKSLEKAHRLLRELWRSAALVIQNIVPQIESELAAENVDVRVLATETVGDLISGIGAAGPPAPVPLDPAAYPSQSIDPPSAYTRSYNFLTTPAAPHAFSSVHSPTYQSFLNRSKDKAPLVRSIWVTCAGRILATSAGGVGLDPNEENVILKSMSDMLLDTDERVRLAAVQAIGRCDFETIVQRIGSNGSVTTPGSILSNLADRIKDRKHGVRVEAMGLLGRIWGVAAGAITEGNERARALLGAIPSRIFDAIYINDRDITALVQQVLYDSLLPLSFPPIKVNKSASNGDSQRVKDSQVPSSQVEKAPNPDAIRAERLLVLVRDLEQKAKTVFFTFQARQAKMAEYLEAFIKRCEDYNGGVGAKNGKEGSSSLSRLIEFFARQRPEPLNSNEHLWKFAKKHDRRCYQLIRFAISPESDYKKVNNAIKELTKRIEEQPGHSPAVLGTLLPIIHQASVLVYNKSHVPTIVELSRTESKGLGSAAHEVLHEISSHNPQVFKAHVRNLCATLQEQVPSQDKPTDPGVVETLKSCASFAQRFPAEIPHERAFLQAMVQFALHGNPPIAAKHAVSVVVAADEKRDMYVKEIVTKCVEGFEYGKDDFLSKLAALSQLMLLSAKDIEVQHDNIVEIAIQKVLLQVRTLAKDSDAGWQEEMDEECQAKIWALKTLANRLRSYAMSLPDNDMETVAAELAQPVFKLLTRIIEKDGELSKNQGETPKSHKARLRLTAAILLLKLCSAHKRFDALVTPKNFNQLIVVAQDALPEVRSAFVDAIKKYLGQGRLPHRFYTLVFMFAFEPNESIKDATLTWLRGRSAYFSKSNDTVMEATFARFLSLLAHHPDFSRTSEELQDFVEYIIFYLKAVATQANVALIYHVAQRIKSVRDGIDEAKSDNLYCLSDLAQAIIRRFQELQGWGLSVWPGKLRLPAGLFAPLPSHTVAQEISEKQYAPEELLEKVEDLVRISMRTKKRKSENTSNQAKKRSRTSDGKMPKATSTKKAAKSVKTPKKPRASKVPASAPASEIRRSSRKSEAKSYIEQSDSEEDEDVMDYDNEEEDDEEEEEEEDGQEGEDAGEGGEEEEEEEEGEEVPEAPAPSKRPTRAQTSKKAAAPQKRQKRGKRKGDAASESELSDVPSDMEE